MTGLIQGPYQYLGLVASNNGPFSSDITGWLWCQTSSVVPTVGGIAELPEVPQLGLDSSGPAGHGTEVLAGVAAAAAALSLVVGGAAGYAWKRFKT